MIQVILYTRDGCHLCDDVQKLLSEFQEKFPHDLKIVDIDNDPLLAENYGDQIPLVKIDEFVLKAPISSQELGIVLESAVNRAHSEKGLIGNVSIRDGMSGDSISYKNSETKAVWSKSDRFSYWLATHYLAIINFFVILFLGFPILAPVFMKIGWTSPATFIYRVYSVTCHQLAFRSFFLFGEQPYYPREEAFIPGIKSYSEASQLGEGYSPQEIMAARNFVGNETTGYKIALCQRDLAIYTGILAFNMIFVLLRRRVKPLHWVLWILIGLMPVGIDGMSQLISQPPLSLLPFRESTPLFRLATGFLFGFTTAWFGIPHIEASMADSLELLDYKKSKLQKNT